MMGLRAHLSFPPDWQAEMDMLNRDLARVEAATVDRLQAAKHKVRILEAKLDLISRALDLAGVPKAPEAHGGPLRLSRHDGVSRAGVLPIVEPATPASGLVGDECDCGNCQ